MLREAHILSIGTTYSSGSPIIPEDLHIIGTHTRGANSGVRMRKELLPFIEESIRKHQAFLENLDTLEALRAKEKERADQALIDKGKAQGLAEGKAEGEKTKAIEIARKLISMNLPMDQIILVTGLTEDESSP